MGYDTNKNYYRYIRFTNAGLIVDSNGKWNQEDTFVCLVNGESDCRNHENLHDSLCGEECCSRPSSRQERRRQNSHGPDDQDKSEEVRKD